MALKGGPGSGPRGMRCLTHKRVKHKRLGSVMRCAKFGSRRKTSKKRSKK